MPDQEENGNDLGKSFRSSTQQWYVVCTYQNPLDEAILMRTHNIQFHDKIRRFPQIFVFLSYRKSFIRTQKGVQISHGKPAIIV